MQSLRRLCGVIAACILLFGMLPLVAARAEGDPADGDPALMSSDIALSPTDASGNEVPAVSGEYKEAVRILIPLKMLAGGITDLSVCPVVGNLETFPFSITKQDYTKTLADYYPGATPVVGDIFEFAFHLTIDSDATKGTKMVAFLVKYKLSGVDKEMTVTIPVTVTKAKAVSSGTHTRIAPKVIIDAFVFDPVKIYAGDAFELALDFRNTSTGEAIRNMQVSISDSTGTVMPSSNGSNTQYIDRIEAAIEGKNNVRSLIFPMQVVPDADAKAVLLTVDVTYNGATSREEYKSTETIAVPVQQKVRVRFSDPIVYDDVWAGQSAAMSVQMFNLGKATVYNALVDVEGDGLKMEESYFGGNVAAGGTMRADFNIIAEVPGQIAGAVLITYEDVYGTETIERLPFSVYVNSSMTGEEMPMPGKQGMATSGNAMPGDKEASATGGAVRLLGMPWYVLVIVLLALVAGVVGLIVRNKKKRERELMEQ